jgi:hypothetical protein
MGVPMNLGSPERRWYVVDRREIDILATTEAEETKNKSMMWFGMVVCSPRVIRVIQA